MNNLIKFLAFLTLSTAASACDSSQYGTVLSCYITYFDFYNLTLSTSDSMLPNFFDFVKSRGAYELSSPYYHFKQACIIQTQLTTCLGSAVSCINPDDLGKIFKYKNNENYKYTGDYFTNNYKCDTAYNYILDNYHCLSVADFSGEAKIEACFNTFNQAITQNPCSAANNLISCMELIYLSYCGQKAADYTCNVMKTEMTYDVPSCKNNLMTCNPV
uniref:DUF19 domain-containing protein n=1 Tax=Parastrongyloides trichosuri TaxID=131310 RepID=A0A0N4Z4R5_PARTI